MARTTPQSERLIVYQDRLKVAHRGLDSSIDELIVKLTHYSTVVDDKARFTSDMLILALFGLGVLGAILIGRRNAQRNTR